MAPSVAKEWSDETDSIGEYGYDLNSNIKFNDVYKNCAK